MAGGHWEAHKRAGRWAGWLAVLVVAEQRWVPPTTAKERTLPFAVSPISASPDARPRLQAA